MEGEGSTWMVKEFGVMHEEVSSSFMKQAEQYNALSHKVSSTKEGFDALSKANVERELQIRERETELAREDDVVKRLRIEHASLEENNQRMRDQEEQLEATRKEEHSKYIKTLDKCTRQMYASRQASRDACKAPELARQPGEDSPASAGPPPLQLSYPWLSLAPCGSLAPVKATAHLPPSRWTRCASCSRASRRTWASGCLCPKQGLYGFAAAAPALAVAWHIGGQPAGGGCSGAALAAACGVEAAGQFWADSHRKCLQHAYCRLVHNDALDMIRVGFNLKGFEMTVNGYAEILDRCDGAVRG